MKLHIAGDVAVPGDKSITHRALMLASAAEGESRLRGLLAGDDCRSTAAVLRALGVAVPELPADGGELRIASHGLAHWREPAEILDCGNSGTTTRLMLGLLAGRPFEATLTGDGSLRQRPMRRVTEPLGAMGARIDELEHADRLPIRMRGGALRPFQYTSPKASAQIKSALLFAGLSGGVPVRVAEPYPSRDHTERMLSAMGVQIVSGEGDDGWAVSLTPPAGPLPPLELAVPGDPSSAAFLVAAALLADTGELRIRDVGVNPTRIGFIRLLARMGAFVELHEERSAGGEPIADLVVRPAPLRGVEIGAAEVPALIDELPVIAALAARAEGETRITGAAELRAKESDRIRAMVGNLRAIGVEAEELPDGLVVRGSDRPLGGRIHSHGDHRIAMAFGALAARPENQIRIDDPDVVRISYPGFWAALARITSREKK